MPARVIHRQSSINPSLSLTVIWYTSLTVLDVLSELITPLANGPESDSTWQARQKLKMRVIAERKVYLVVRFHD